MKRIALLLAGAVLGTGCFIDTCDSETLSIDWSLVDGSDNFGVACNSLSLSDDVTHMTVWVDGYDETGLVSCGAGGVTIGGVSTGNHQVVVEGYNSVGNVITRGFATVDVGSCGDTARLVEVGEEWITILPDTCVSGADVLWFSLRDVTWPGLDYEIWARDASFLTGWDDFSCATGIDVPVPYGDYTLDWIDEVTTGKALRDWGFCADYSFPVYDSVRPAINVTMVNDAACHI